jgi:type I restriction-modification system DNA methylase subunit
MTNETFKDIEKLETDLWEAADNLRANSKLTSSDYFMPVLGVIFLRHAANRFDAAHRQIEADQAGAEVPKRKVLPADYIARRSLYLPENARYDWIMQQAAVSGADLTKLVTEAMTAIESEFEPLVGVLPKDYGIFETKVLEDLMRTFNSEQIKQATGDVDVMISIRSNFFYTRTVPCELWHFDRAKPAERKDKVLMLDARNVYRKVTRKIYDFSPEQMHNLAAVWLYRGQQERFLGLVKDYLAKVCAESVAVRGTLTPFETTLADLRGRFDSLAKAVAKHADHDTNRKKAFADAVNEMSEATTLYEADAEKLLASLHAFGLKYMNTLPAGNDAQHTVRKAYAPNAEAIRGLVKQVDLLYKLAARVADLGVELAADDAISATYDRRTTSRLVKLLDEERKEAVEQLKHAIYFHRQVAWLQDRFPKAELQAVPGLVKLVDRSEIEAAEWSLTPGRYVGVAPQEEDEDFDFEQTLRDIHTELVDLNKEAAELAAKIQANFEELGA